MSEPKVAYATAEALATAAPIQQDPEKLGGSPTIGKYRVHAETLIDYFAGGLTLADFMEDFEGTPKEEVLAVLGVVRQGIRDGLLTGLQVRLECDYRGLRFHQLKEEKAQ